MNDQAQTTVLETSARAGAPTASSPPDINAETYPFEFVQRLLDAAAYVNLFSLPDTRISSTEPYEPTGPNGVIGFEVREILHRFQVELKAVSPESGIVSENRIGEPLARLEHRWLLMPTDFVATPDRQPPPTRFDPTRSQRFVMLASTCHFEETKDGFRGFGTGRTYPVNGSTDGRVLVAAVGTIVEGFGRLKNRDCTYTYCGSLSPRSGFSGQLLLRVVDPAGDLSTDTALPALEGSGHVDTGIKTRR